MVVGSSVASTFAPGLKQWAAQHGNVQVLDKARFWCSLGRGLPIGQGLVTAVPTSCSDWETRWSEAIRSFDPDVVLVFFSMWEVSPRQLPGSNEWLTPGDQRLDTWQLAEYQTAADVLSARGAAVDWLTIPCENEPTEVGSPLWYVNRRTIPELAASRPAVHVVDLDHEMCHYGASHDYAGVHDARPDGAHFSRRGRVRGREVADGGRARRATEPAAGGEPNRRATRSFEEHADALAVVDPADRFAEEAGDRDRPRPCRQRDRLGLDRVGDEQPLDRAAASRSTAVSVNSPWRHHRVARAAAPRSMRMRAASTSEPAEIVKSSTISAVFPSTSRSAR